MKEIKLSEKAPKLIIEKIKEKFPIAKCREILERRGKKFTEEQILMIRDFLISISNVAYQTFQKQVQKEADFELEKQNDNIIQLKSQNSNDTEIKNAA
ncbi:MAG: hypothetical protein ABIP51_04795 [Bacteroidia bacterium]